jgi:hypothetical protein
MNWFWKAATEWIFFGLLLLLPAMRKRDSLGISFGMGVTAGYRWPAFSFSDQARREKREPQTSGPPAVADDLLFSSRLLC